MPSTIPDLDAAGVICPRRPRATDRNHGACLRPLDRWGWILFLVCALLFVAAGVRDGDALITTGSVLFLVACVFFLVPHRRG